MTDRAHVLLAARREALATAFGAPLPAVARGSRAPLSPAEAQHLQGEGENLYWNDLEWEKLTDEEALEGEPLAEMIFPGFLAFLRGLLLDEVMPDAKAPADPRPESVERLLLFLAERVVSLNGEGGGGNRREAELTERLLDLGLALLHGLPGEVIDRLESAVEGD